MTTINFNSIPKEIRLWIFSFLPATQLMKIETVCKSWQRDLQDPSLWNYFCRKINLPLNSLEQSKDTYLKASGLYFFKCVATNPDPQIQEFPDLSNQGGCLTALWKAQNNLLCGYSCGKFELRNLDTLNIVSSFQTGSPLSSIISFGSYAICGSNNISFWNLLTKKCDKTLEGHLDTVDLFELQDNTLFSMSRDSIHQWDLSTFDKKGPSFHDASLYFYCMRVIDNKIMTVQSSNEVKTWDRSTGTCTHTFSTINPWFYFQFLSEDLIYVRTDSGSLEIWETKNLKFLKSVETTESLGFGMLTLSIKEIGNTIVFVGKDAKHLIVYQHELNRNEYISLNGPDVNMPFVIHNDFLITGADLGGI